MGPRGDGLECGSRAQAARKPVPEKVAEAWAREWAREWAKAVDWRSLMPPRGFRVLPRRWVVERTFAHLRAPSRTAAHLRAPSCTFAWIGHNRRMSKDYERLCATGEAFDYAAMTRLMVRRLARA